MRENEIYRYTVDDTIDCALFVCLLYRHLASTVVEMLEFHLVKVIMSKWNGCYEHQQIGGQSIHELLLILSTVSMDLLNTTVSIDLLNTILSYFNF